MPASAHGQKDGIETRKSISGKSSLQVKVPIKEEFLQVGVPFM
jgi:hypothetical protein